MTKRALIRKEKKQIKKRKEKRIRYKFIKINSKTKKIPPKALTQNKNEPKIKDTETNKTNSIINIELIKSNMAKYADKLTNIHFEKYAKSNLADLLRNESNTSNINITQKILNKFNLTKENRKNALKYLFNIINTFNFNIKCYFSTFKLFDLFLINYSEDELNKNKCKTFFVSKKSNNLSETKIILLMLCCFYLTTKYFSNTKVVKVSQLLEFEDTKEETTYDELIVLMDDIINYTDADICDKNIYYFIESYIFDIYKAIKEYDLTRNQRFLQFFETSVANFSIKIVQDFDLLNISESKQALAIIIFCYDFSKFYTDEKNELMDDYIRKWKANFNSFIKNEDINEIQNILDWLNNVSKYYPSVI